MHGAPSGGSGGPFGGLSVAKSDAIIGVGNRLMPDDNLGPRVHDLLAESDLPSDVALIDGGLRGLDLWPEMEGRRRVVFADALTEGVSSGVAVFDGQDLATMASAFGHGAGLPYLLGALPYMVASPPESVVVGAPAPAGEETVRIVARHCLAMINHDPR